MNWEQINEWFDAFHDEYVEGKKLVRGRAFSGAKIEIYGRDSIAIVLHGPYLRGTTQDEKAVELVKNIFDQEHQSIQAEINYERFQHIVNGEHPLTDVDWFWLDE